MVLADKALSTSDVQMAREQGLQAALEGRNLCIKGNLFAQVVCVTGLAALSEAAHEALQKAFRALGYADEDFCAIALDCPKPSTQTDLLFAIEALDPLVVVSLDEAAARRCALALGISVPRYGVTVCGGPGAQRRFVAVEDFEASLASQELKKISWGQLKAARRQTRFI